MSSKISIEMRNQEQIVIRAKFDDKKTSEALKKAGLETPAMRHMAQSDAGSVMWFSPDEMLVFVNNAEEAIAKIAPALPPRHLIHDATGARVVFRLEGRYLRDVFAKGAPRDIRKVEIGEVVRTRLGQIAVAFWFLDENKAELVCFRSVGEYVGKWLERAALEDGLPVIG